MPCVETAAAAKELFHSFNQAFMAVGSFNMAKMMSKINDALGRKSDGNISNTAVPSHGNICGKTGAALAAKWSSGPIADAMRE